MDTSAITDVLSCVLRTEIQWVLVVTAHLVYYISWLAEVYEV